METIHLNISGKVQGVFYRASAKKKAKELDIRGWIKNTAAGNVEAIVSGNPIQVQNFIKWCKCGPENAVVEEVIATKRAYTQFDTFQIKR